MGSFATFDNSGILNNRFIFWGAEIQYVYKFLLYFLLKIRIFLNAISPFPLN